MSYLDNMTLEDITKEIREYLSTRLGMDINRIEPESRFYENLHTDSLDIVEMQIDLEEIYKIDIPDSEMNKIKSTMRHHGF